MNSFSEGRPSQRARAPVATITESAVKVFPPTETAKGRDGEVHRAGVELVDLGAEALGLTPEEVHHFVAGDPVGKARVVLHVGGEHELAAREADVRIHPRAGQQQGLEFGASGIQRRRVAGGAAADDDKAAGFSSS